MVRSKDVPIFNVHTVSTRNVHVDPDETALFSLNKVSHLDLHNLKWFTIWLNVGLTLNPCPAE